MSKGNRLLLMWLLLVLMGSMGQVGPSVAQPPEQPEESEQLEAILHVTVADLKVQGDYTPEAVREAFTAVLPAVAACLQREHQRHGKVPAQLTLRFNLSGSGKVVWTKLIDPPWKSLDACLGKALASLRLPATGTTLSRATVILECRSDHLLQP